MYRLQESRPQGGSRGRKPLFIACAAVLFAAIIGFITYRLLTSSPVSLRNTTETTQFDQSITGAEQQHIRDAIEQQGKVYKNSIVARAETSFTASDVSRVLAAYVPVTNVYAVRQQITKAELPNTSLLVPAGLDAKVRSAIAVVLGVDVEKLVELTVPVKSIPDAAVAFIPVDQLSPELKLLAFEGAYYLDSFDKGAVFRQVIFGGAGSEGMTGLRLNTHLGKEATLKVNMTGVTALTRTMISKLNSVKDPTHFSQKIGPFLADADITHVSNEVSFKNGCAYHLSLFCSPPSMIEALKASGVDLVELTGNHNNDVGSQSNTESINLYRSLGWHTVGGGLNAEDAAKPYIADLKANKVAFLAYNDADGLGSGAIARSALAGANYFDVEKIKADIAAAKQQVGFVIVSIQFWECQAYPSGYVEYPQCDVPIPTQKDVFRQVADLGADMVVGTSAHQPQTYELYNGKPIYYGLGNLYFEQTQWPGTERGIILTHYFSGGKLLQTKLSPTVYGKELQTRLMDNGEALKLLERLKTARATAGL